MTYYNPWLYNNKILEDEDLENYVGFVYKITNKLNGKFYIGKKSSISTKTKIIKGKKKKTKSISAWKSYWGSSSYLKEDIEKLGKENFSREVLHLSKTKTDLSYLELKEQILQGVMETDLSYNIWIMVRIRKNNVKLI